MQIYQLAVQGDISSAIPVSGDHWLVDVTAKANLDTYKSADAEIGALCDHPMISSIVSLRPKKVWQS
ncbi:hypothetical protein CYMTET_20315 [Cymbomonas tetramitiformis]|uniref:Uncharacterized protein n=1 Tax=Cymbomonas tetramitiformis TaxID=36881 RepID=A0AAE0G4S7_9CHLO|nr:hypothetical protein CYMTET_20315 [Cymbomonas tetramitiformis]